MSASKQMTNLLTGLFLWAFLGFLPAQAQTTATITTLPLETTAVCPGSVIKVAYIYTGKVGKLSLQISYGDSFTTIQTVPKFYSDDYFVCGLIPDNLPKDKIYRVRVISSDPDVIGSISSKTLIIKNGPVPPRPLVDSLHVECMRTSANNYYTLLRAKVISGAKLVVYRLYEDGFKIREDQQSRFGTNSEWKNFELFKSGIGVWSYEYPVSEGTYYFSQIVDGCESEKAKTIFRELYRPGTGLDVENSTPASGPYVYSTIRYCQGDVAVPINRRGYTLRDAEHFYVIHSPGSTTVVPIPSTDQPGRQGYDLQVVPKDPTKACTAAYGVKLSVIIDPRPTAPTVPTPTLTYYKYQPTVALTATASSTATTLRWYLPDASGVPSLTSATAPIPPTNQPGSFTYLVSQMQGNCEGPRYPVTVNVSAETPGLAELITVHPVPATTALTVAIATQQLRHSPATLELIDASGQVLWQRETREGQTLIPLQSIKTGSYSLRVRMGEQQAVKRLVKL